jgi:hypothetical protein
MGVEAGHWPQLVAPVRLQPVAQPAALMPEGMWNCDEDLESEPGTVATHNPSVPVSRKLEANMAFPSPVSMGFTGALSPGARHTRSATSWTTASFSPPLMSAARKESASSPPSVTYLCGGGVVGGGVNHLFPNPVGQSP